MPVHIHPTQDEFILVQEGSSISSSTANGCKAKAGDLVRLPRGIPHGYFNKSDKPARALFWVSPMQKLEALFDRLAQPVRPRGGRPRLGPARGGLPAAGSQRLGGLTHRHEAALR